MLKPQYTTTDPPRQESWSIYSALTADTLAALRAAGIRICGSHVLARVCPECGQQGEVGVCEGDLVDAIAFIAADRWTCRRCREKATAHLVPSPRPYPASRGQGATGSVGKNPRRPSAPSARARSKRQQIAVARREFDAAVADGDVVRANAAYHLIIRLGGRVQWPAGFDQEVQA